MSPSRVENKNIWNHHLAHFRKMLLQTSFVVFSSFFLFFPHKISKPQLDKPSKSNLGPGDLLMIGIWRSRFTCITPLKRSLEKPKLPSPGHEQKKLVGWKNSLKSSLDLLPRKLTCPLKIKGWKMSFLLKWSPLRGLFSFQGCTSIADGWTKPFHLKKHAAHVKLEQISPGWFQGETSKNDWVATTYS